MRGQLRQSDLRYVSAICRHHVGFILLSEKCHSAGTCVHYSGGLRALFGNSNRGHRLKVRLFLFFGFRERNELTHTKEIDCSRPTVAQHHSSLTSSLQSAHLPTQTDTLAWVKPSAIHADPCLHTPQRRDQMSECPHCQASFLLTSLSLGSFGVSPLA